MKTNTKNGRQNQPYQKADCNMRIEIQVNNM